MGQRDDTDDTWWFICASVSSLVLGRIARGCIDCGLSGAPWPRGRPPFCGPGCPIQPRHAAQMHVLTQQLDRVPLLPEPRPVIPVVFKTESERLSVQGLLRPGACPSLPPRLRKLPTLCPPDAPAALVFSPSCRPRSRRPVFLLLLASISPPPFPGHTLEALARSGAV